MQIPPAQTTVQRTTPAGSGRIVLTTRSSGRHTLSVNDGVQNQYAHTPGECYLDDTDLLNLYSTIGAALADPHEAPPNTLVTITGWLNDHWTGLDDWDAAHIEDIACDLMDRLALRA